MDDFVIEINGAKYVRVDDLLNKITDYLVDWAGTTEDCILGSTAMDAVDNVYDFLRENNQPNSLASSREDSF